MRRWLLSAGAAAAALFAFSLPAAAGESFEPLPGVGAASFSPYRLSCALLDPLPGAEPTDGYGWRYHPITGSLDFHYGDDLAAPSGTPIRAAAGGTVTTAASHDSYGNYLVIRHAGDFQTLYAHCSELLVEAGDTVEAGETVALVGATGMATGPHLHFEVILSGIRHDPGWASYREAEP